jgi:hypothetical protein
VRLRTVLLDRLDRGHAELRQNGVLRSSAGTLGGLTGAVVLLLCLLGKRNNPKCRGLEARP